MRGTSDHSASIMSVSEDEAFELACRIWFEAPGRAAQELSQLPTMERERVWADLTGSKEISNFELPIEDPAVIEQHLEELRADLVQYKTNYPSRPLGLVLNTTPEYVCDPKFMLRFLRASDYRAKSAMGLLCRHFEMKQELFGNDRLGRDIRLSDFTKEDMEFMTRGTYQYLRDQDRAGRFISFMQFADPAYSRLGGKYKVLRTMFYLNTTMSEMESVQRLGIVRVGYFHHSYPMGGPDNELIRMSLRIIDSVPIRSVAFYLFSGSSLWSQTLDLMVILCRPWLRVRTRIVSGSFYENLYTLLCLGIPQNCVPTREDGAILNDNLLAWIQERRAVENGKERT